MATDVFLGKRCQRCGLPETYETLVKDQEGVCSICRSSEYKNQIDWDARLVRLHKLVDEHRGQYQYDCVVPFSGGKDSTFQLWYIVKKLGLKPLVVRFNHGFLRPTIRDNTTRTLRTLGADFIDFTPNWQLVKKLMLESLRRKGDFCWHCHTGIYSYPIRMAIAFRVPLVFWGEPQSEITSYFDYASDEVEWEDERKFYLLRTLGITAEDMHSILSKDHPELEQRELMPYSFPDRADIEDLGLMSVPLGSFIPWDYQAQSEIIKQELGWETDELEGIPNSINKHGEKIECFMQGTRDYIKFVKRGYSRAAQISAFTARTGEISQADAIENGLSHDGKRPPSLDIFLEYVGLSESEFHEIIKTFEVAPYEHDFAKETNAEKTWDFDQWYREAHIENDDTNIS